MNHAGRDNNDADFGPEHARQRQAHRVERRLGGGVDHRAAGAGLRRARGDVDDDTVAGLAQQRREGADRREDAAHIGGEDLVDEVVGKRFEIVVRHHAGKAGGIDENVGAAEFLPDRRGSLSYFRTVLERQADRFVPAAGEALDHRVRTVCPLVVADDDPRAGLGKEPRAGGADPAAGAGDDRNLAGEVLADLRRHSCSPRKLSAASMLRTLSGYCHRVSREGRLAR